MEETKKVAWNSAEGLIMEISNRRVSANTAFVSGDIRKAFYTLVSIRQTTNQSYTDEERAKLKMIEEKFRKISGALSANISRSFDPDLKQLHSLAFHLAIKIYAEYNDFLQDLLNDRGYLIAEQQDITTMRF